VACCVVTFPFTAAFWASAFAEPGPLHRVSSENIWFSNVHTALLASKRISEMHAKCDGLLVLASPFPAGGGNGRDKNEIENVWGARFIYVDSTTNVALCRLDSADLDRVRLFPSNGRARSLTYMNR
jgi:hypothetical protein